jgi:hypothetical protein
MIPLAQLPLCPCYPGFKGVFRPYSCCDKPTFFFVRKVLGFVDGRGIMLALLKRLGGTKNLLQDCSNWETALQIQQEQAAIKDFFLVSL